MAKPKMIRKIRINYRVLKEIPVVSVAMGAIIVEEELNEVARKSRGWL